MNVGAGRRTSRRRRGSLALILLVLPALAIPSSAAADSAGMSRMEPAPGQLDTTFGGDGWVVTDDGDWGGKGAALLQPDGKIVVAGSLRYQVDVWRFLENGAVDASFGGDGRVTIDLPGREGGGLAAALQPDGKIVVAGYAGLSLAVVRLLPDGSLDPSFGGGTGMTMIRVPGKRAQTEDVEVLADGRILLGGPVTRVRPDKSGFRRMVGLGLTLLTPSGAPDPSFGTDGTVRAPILFADLTLDGQGLVVLGIDRKRSSLLRFARYHLDGSRNQAFANRGVRSLSLGKKVEVYDGEIVVDSTGKIMVSLSGASRLCFFGYGVAVRLNADGSPDTTFSSNGVQRRRCVGFSQLAVQADGKIVLAGESFQGAGSGEYYPVLARILGDGAADMTFGDEGAVLGPPDGEFYNWSASADVSLQPDGRIVLLVNAIWEDWFGVARFHAA
jgi:uncharacterized delta-60 repeat protein